MTYAVTTQTTQDITQSTHWRAVVDVYLAAGVDSPNTRRAYARHLRDALTLFGVDTLAGLTGADLARYRALVTSSELSPSSQGQALAALRALLKWSGPFGAHTLPIEVIDRALRTPKAEVKRPYAVLSDAEAGGLLQAAGNPRDRAIVGVMLGAGLRVSEVVGLDPADLVIDQDGAASLYVRSGKGRKDRQVPVQDDVAGLIRAYLQDTGRTLTTTGPLFVAHDRAAGAKKRGRLTDNAVRQLVTRLAQTTNIDAKAVSPHTLRHTYGTRHYSAAKNLLALQELLGHSSVTTTQRYARHFEQSALRATVPALPSW